MYCKNCGAQVDNDVTVCPECGMEITADDIREADDFSDELSRRDKLEEIKERRNRKRKKEQKKRIIAVVILVAAIIAAAGGVLAWLNSNFGGRVEVEEPQKTAVPVTASPEPTELPSETPIISEEPTISPETQTANPAEATPAPAIDNEVSDATSTVAPRPNKTKKPNATAKPAASNNKSTSAKTSSAVKANAKPKTSSAVPMGSAIQNKYVEFKQAFPRENSNVDIMSFDMGGEVYYANVNKGTTTAQIDGKYYYITAHATDVSYNGKPVYEITSMSTKKLSGSTESNVEYSGDYVLSDSSAAYVTDEQLNALTKSQLSLARNEIYARHGRKFKSSSLQKYFESKSWYSVNPNYNYANDSANLNQIEKSNILKILKAESSR